MLIVHTAAMWSVEACLVVLGSECNATSKYCLGSCSTTIVGRYSLEHAVGDKYVTQEKVPSRQCQTSCKRLLVDITFVRNEDVDHAVCHVFSWGIA